MSFDTFVEAQVTIVESEDYNYGSGQGSNNPPAGAFANLASTYGVDFIDSSLWSVGVYRSANAVDDQATADFPRPRFVSSGATDYEIGFIARGEWCNYSRTITVGSYSAGAEGCFDMAGNAFEWTRDYYTISSYIQLAEKMVDPCVEDAATLTADDRPVEIFRSIHEARKWLATFPVKF